jgi:hypothetical protein
MMMIRHRSGHFMGRNLRDIAEKIARGEYNARSKIKIDAGHFETVGCTFVHSHQLQTDPHKARANVDV